MIRFEDLEEKVQAHYPNADLDLLRKAYVFSAREHRGQVRLSGEPYLSHPLEVANILCDMKLDVACVCVGLLHDVVEDTLTPLEKIEEIFGEDIAHIVDGVTKMSKIQFSSQREQQAENFRKLLLAMVDDIRVILVKLADRLHNMRTLQYLSPEKRKAIAQETLDIYAPIAHRLGMSKIRGELEDIAFSYLDPVTYQSILSQVEEKKATSDRLIKSAIKQMEQRFQEQGIEAKIEARIKRIHSTYEKLRRQKIALDQVYDFIAIRVLVGTVRDCYTVLGIVNNMWNPVPGRIKDFIAMPRPNMYQSLHTTVIGSDGRPFEIQIRTSEMHKIAEEGIAAHWKYKEGKLEKHKDDKRFMWLRHLLEWQREVKDPNQFLSNLKIDLYPEEVYVFTPKGEVITLPRGATPVDFAFYIHTAVGSKCVGAKINGRIVPLKHRLVNGEIVEILTADDAHPSREWLTFAKTSRARNAVRRWINQRQKEQAVDLGQKLLEKEAEKFNMNLRKYQDRFDTVSTELNFPKPEDLYQSIGFGKTPAKRVLQQLEPERIFEQAQPVAPESRLSSMVRRVLRRSDSTIKVKGHEDLLVYRAKCCNPIPGEEIAGYITVGRGISVHSTSCPNVESLLLDPEKRVAVSWMDEGRDSKYPVRLRIHAEDRTGILAAITSAVSSANTKIVTVQARVLDEGYGRVDMTVEVAGTDQLDKLMDLLKGLAGVREVARARSRARKASD
ncbi:MAG: bifunctional (p)ppGpp synthetase/guanosine-3',5'-bis(diphosphate) 3'-pyrophosphohydrolase [Acidobacteria bacterium]|nr:MAG: bifunctional (p)ppGpp synthetase/guanosine-3',5'-bis(diphosphate) 3'-pyrophosphohydrolase [Acidobacteriota bacterium]